MDEKLKKKFESTCKLCDGDLSKLTLRKGDDPYKGIDSWNKFK